MSSKRGRKRNDNLPPNRARDVQRAFRARRAAHLLALEQRVSELEEENDYLRQALNLPPSNRPPLGRGPTGKDKPKPNPNPPTNPLSTLFQQLQSSSTRETSVFLDSPPSRDSTDSPVSIPVSMSPSRPMTVLDSNAWSDNLLVDNVSRTLPPPPITSTSTYHISPITVPSTVKMDLNVYAASSATPSRNITINRTYDNPGNVLTGNSVREYGPMSYTSQTTQLADEQPRTHYDYMSTLFQNQQPSAVYTRLGQTPSPSEYVQQQSDQTVNHPQSHCSADAAMNSCTTSHPTLVHPRPMSHPAHSQSQPYRPHSLPMQSQSRQDMHPPRQSSLSRRETPVSFVDTTTPARDHHGYAIGQNCHLTNHPPIQNDPRSHDYALRLHGIEASVPRQQVPYAHAPDGHLHRA
ncbi:hypothetical protein CC1G_06435 [Coprinopsis cinerea okayama7|uniref:BZIP domain-containing protein n=1 Tax=Coprinopsis cinerea (strain Okayama-7 / 130 / ATCC MYA-4618 / FGSC 9003) TaxID=240176 RepID=A8NU06_COPC7|nr:hypothetical protein CC1G_06435 [Coprinopsis cinerea okayama7\|eukprot:XP_001836350.1 hypothetical protein CC1G_06435 [Coprinopsis cinerea okayama7\